MILSQILLLALFLGLISISQSCVGTRQSYQTENTKIYGEKKINFDFSGIELVVPISHDKVELYFFPIAGIDPENITYYIYHDGQEYPETIPATSLFTDYRGYLVHTISNLRPLTSYSFIVEAKHIKDNTNSANQKALSGTTFSNKTAVFGGISEIYNLPGVQGMYGIEVSWGAAQSLGTEFNPNEIDVIEYEIIAIDAEKLTPVDFDNDFYTSPDRMVFKSAKTNVNYIVNGLLPGTPYYVRVRAIHSGSLSNLGNPNYKLEENNKYRKITTYSDSLSSIDFDPTSFSGSMGLGEEGLSSIDFTWKNAIGVFDHYRIYYTMDGSITDSSLSMYSGDAICNGKETANPKIFCKQFLDNVSKGTITDLVGYTEYRSVLSVCLNQECASAMRLISNIAKTKTSPPLAQFPGIKNIRLSDDPNDLDTVVIEYYAPLFSSGIIDGLLVVFTGEDQTESIPLNHPITPELNLTDFLVRPFNIRTETMLEISNVNFTDYSSLCFSIQPFAYDTPTSIKTDEGSASKDCFTPIVTPPSESQFLGITSCAGQGGGFASLSWSPPTAGIYSDYEIYYIENTGGTFFSYPNALSGSPGYRKVVVDRLESGLTIPFLESGKTYLFGALTYFSFNGVDYRSTFNSGVVSCTIP